MVDTEAPPVPHAPLVASWTAPVIDAGKVHDELDRLWGAWSEAKRKSLSTTVHGAPEWELMRASTLNLIVIAETPKHAEAIETTVNSLTEFAPSRTVLLVRSGAPKAGGL